MRLWHVPARTLPVVTRPIAGETVPSYARRLSAANDLPGTSVLRALGEFAGKGSGTHLLTCDAWLNEHATDRLEAYTGIPRDRLACALPAVLGEPHRPLPPNRPALCFRVAHTRPACRRCQLAAAGPAGPEALVLPGWTPLACLRHRRWLGPAHETTQHDLAPAPSVLAACRRLKAILARSDDRAWAWTEFRTAWNMARAWPAPGIERMPALAQRWRDRAAALGTTPIVTTQTGKRASWIVAFPEAVALTEIITDLNLRRHVALEWDDGPLYLRIAAAIGEQRYPSWPWHGDPVRDWARIHRARFERLRGWSWSRPQPPPERFK